MSQRSHTPRIGITEINAPVVPKLLNTAMSKAVQMRAALVVIFAIERTGFWRDGVRDALT